MSDGFGTRFLSQPDRLEQQLAGPAWGGRSLTVAIAGVGFRVMGISEEQHRLLLSRLPEWAVAPESTPIVSSTAVVEARKVAFKRVDTRGWEFSLDLRHRPEEVAVAGLESAALFRWPSLEGTVATCAAGGDAFHGVIENHLRVLAAYSLLARGGVVLHAAAVGFGERAALFFGPSGSGKSTVATAAEHRGLATASDDLNAVALSGEAAHLAALPFARTGVLPPGAKLPIGALFRLRQWAGTEVRSLAPAEAVAALTACAPFVNRDPHRAGQLLTVLTSLVLSVPVYELRFDLSGGMWEPVGALLEGVR